MCIRIQILKVSRDMAGEQSLELLIQSMEPVLHPETYLFCTLGQNADVSGLNPIMQFREVEGLTIIVEKSKAVTHQLEGEFPCRMITLNIHSALDAVGFLAVITTRLAALGMGVNPVSAFYHDHLFVPADKAEDALQSLKKLTETGGV